MSERETTRTDTGTGGTDEEYTVSYYQRGSAEERMSLGQLLDWMTRAREAEQAAVEASDLETAKQYRDYLVDAEAVLAKWRKDLEREPEDPNHMFAEVGAVRGARRDDLQLFRRLCSGVPVDSLPNLAREALSFTREWDRVIALDELVLGGEARVLGIERAAARRSAARAEFLDGLKERLVDILSAPGDGAGS